jgi:hypothetical protein
MFINPSLVVKETEERVELQEVTNDRKPRRTLHLARGERTMTKWKRAMIAWEEQMSGRITNFERVLGLPAIQGNTQAEIEEATSIRLFDEGYLTIHPSERCVLVSKRIREEFENGKDYYRLEGLRIREPIEAWARPSSENLEFHAHSVFR